MHILYDLTLKKELRDIGIILAYKIDFEVRI